ncbi:MAG: ABC transporter permease subunit, partial [Betaproteobacteria bacterium]|nr:ABC transporter permease subunit [Betaproteobacteria bacterium]
IGQVISLGYAVPGAVVVIGILLPVVWLRTVGWGADWGYWVTGTSLGLIWAYLVRFTSVAMQTVDSGYTRLSYRLDETSQTLGVHGASMFRRVHMPLLRKSTYVAALLVLVDVLKELPVTLVLRPFDSDTLAVAAYQLARDERLDAAALPALALVLVGLVPVILLSRELKSSDR